jgi:Rps23 Pro-64 3,4-dihydroxylase Tpa1-like proline 4-hydroxylase
MNNFFNSSCNFADYKNEFSNNRRIRVKDILDLDVASFTYEALNEKTAYDNAMFLNGQNVTIKKQDWKALSDQQRQEIYFGLMENASKGSGFSYGRKAITDQENNEVLRSFYLKLNSEEVLESIRELTGESEINSASMQATQFVPGQFLTRHKDDIKVEGRKLAYVFNLSPEWHPDWGGLLQFFYENGETNESWTPSFNTLSLFDVKQIHSVTYLTPFAKKPRLSLSGWFGQK